jgi:glutamate-1-semialdehyde 2,1-aminomutase
VLFKLTARGKALWQSLLDVMRSLSLDYTPTGIASMFQVFFGPQPENYEQALKADRLKYDEFWRHMLGHGVFLMPSQFETNFLSAAHTPGDIEQIVSACKRSLAALK